MGVNQCKLGGEIFLSCRVGIFYRLKVDQFFNTSKRENYLCIHMKYIYMYNKHWNSAPRPAMPHHTAWVCFCELELPEPSSQALGTDLHAHPVFTPRKSSLPRASSLDDTGCEHPGAPTAVRGRAGGLARGCPQRPLSWAAGGLVWPAPPRGSVRDCPTRLGPQGSPIIFLMCIQKCIQKACKNTDPLMAVDASEEGMGKVAKAFMHCHGLLIFL